MNFAQQIGHWLGQLPTWVTPVVVILVVAGGIFWTYASLTPSTPRHKWRDNQKKVK